MSASGACGLRGVLRRGARGLLGLLRLGSGGVGVRLPCGGSATGASAAGTAVWAARTPARAGRRTRRRGRPRPGRRGGWCGRPLGGGVGAGDQRRDHLLGGLAVDAGLGAADLETEPGECREDLTARARQQLRERVHSHPFREVIHGGYGDRPAGTTGGRIVIRHSAPPPPGASGRGGRAGARAVLSPRGARRAILVSLHPGGRVVHDGEPAPARGRCAGTRASSLRPGW